MAACNPNELLEEVKCYGCVGATIPQLFRLALLRRSVLNAMPSADTSYAYLIEYSKCYACYGVSQYDMLELALLDLLSGGS